jgi:hypothetical protein
LVGLEVLVAASATSTGAVGVAADPLTATAAPPAVDPVAPVDDPTEVQSVVLVVDVAGTVVPASAVVGLVLPDVLLVAVVVLDPVVVPDPGAAVLGVVEVQIVVGELAELSALPAVAPALDPALVLPDFVVDDEPAVPDVFEEELDPADPVVEDPEPPLVVPPDAGAVDAGPVGAVGTVPLTDPGVTFGAGPPIPH